MKKSRKKLSFAKRAEKNCIGAILGSRSIACAYQSDQDSRHLLVRNIHPAASLSAIELVFSKFYWFFFGFLSDGIGKETSPVADNDAAGWIFLTKR